MFVATLCYAVLTFYVYVSQADVRQAYVSTKLAEVTNQPCESSDVPSWLSGARTHCVWRLG
jgi:hypothetical protein